jgi:hypothetical protein
MTHIHWVARQNKVEIPNDEEEVNTREIHKSDGQTHDPDTMVDSNTKETPTSPKPHTHPSHEHDGQTRNPGVMTVPPTPL